MIDEKATAVLTPQDLRDRLAQSDRFLRDALRTMEETRDAINRECDARRRIKAALEVLGHAD